MLKSLREIFAQTKNVSVKIGGRYQVNDKITMTFRPFSVIKTNLRT